MRTKEEKRKAKQYKWIFKQYHYKFKYRYGIYFLEFSNKEGPSIIYDTYNYKINNNSLDGLIETYNRIKRRA